MLYVNHVLLTGKHVGFVINYIVLIINNYFVFFYLLFKTHTILYRLGSGSIAI